MSETGHDLHALFPAKRDELQTLKTTSAHFRQLAENYHELTHDISRIEIGVEPTSDERLETLKKRRLALLDEVAGLLG